MIAAKLPFHCPTVGTLPLLCQGSRPFHYPGGYGPYYVIQGHSWQWLKVGLARQLGGGYSAQDTP